MGRLTVSDIINYSIENGGKNTLLKLSKTNSKGLNAAELKPYIKKMDEDEAEQSVQNLVRAFMKKGRDHKPELDYWWFGADEDDFDLGGGRRRKKRGGVPLGHRCGTKADCDKGLQCVLHDLLSGPQVDNNQRGVCKTSEGGRRRRRKRTRRRKKSKRRRRKKKRTKKKRRRRRRK